MPDRFDVLGVGVSEVSLDAAAGRIVRAARAGRAGYVCVTGAHGVMEAQRDPELMRIHNESLLTVPDGMPLVWVARRRGLEGVGRVYGPDLMRRVLGAVGTDPGAQSAKSRAEVGSQTSEVGSREDGEGSREKECRSQEWRVGQGKVEVAPSRTPGLRPPTTDLRPPPSHFLLGSTAETLGRLSARIRADFPDAILAGTWSPPFRDLASDEWEEALRRVRESGASIVWVGLSTPKQERFMAEFVRRWEAEYGRQGSATGDRRDDPRTDPTSDFRPPTPVVLVGVGAAFDVLAGLRPDAPNWVKRSGLQWLHRLFQEPRRLGPRYLRVVPGFLRRILPDLILGRRGR